MHNFGARTRSSLERLRALRSVIAIAGALTGAGSAHAETILSADLTVKGQVANNPYLLPGSETSAAAVTASFAPKLTYTDSTATLGILGNIEHTEFSRSYRGTTNYYVTSNLAKRLSPKLSLSADLGYDSSITTANDLVTVPTTLQPIVGPNPSLPSTVAINALQSRRESFSGDAGFDFQPTARDSWHVRSGFSLTRYPAQVVNANYNYFSSSLNYQRVLDGRTSVGVSGSVSRVDYLDTSNGDATTLSPQVTFSSQLDPHWSLSGSAGASFTATQTIIGKLHSTAFSGSISLCRGFERAKLCLNGSRSVQPSLLGGVLPQTNLGAVYSVQLDDRSNIDASANYSISQRQVVGGGLQPLGYGRASLTYNRRITERLKAFVGAGYAGSYHDTISRNANFELNFGLTQTIGGRRS
jgi:hypothetical protein